MHFISTSERQTTWDDLSELIKVKSSANALILCSYDNPIFCCFLQGGDVDSVLQYSLAFFLA